jgi:hypothetical protein
VSREKEVFQARSWHTGTLQKDEWNSAALFLIFLRPDGRLRQTCLLSAVGWHGYLHS